MKIIYFLLFLLPVFIEFNKCINTSGVIKKIFLCILSIGGLMALVGKGTDLICIAACGIYLETLLFTQIKVFIETIKFKRHRKTNT